jgi:hypothetical protein
MARGKGVRFVGRGLLSVAFASFSLAVVAGPHTGFRTLFAPEAARAVDAALAGAERRLAAPSCRRVLKEYRDGAGRTLAEVLDARALTAEAQLRLVVFADGSGQSPCRRSDVVASTMPGSRVVYVCTGAFGALRERNPARAEAVMIHELLHSLGLAEDIPTSRALTDRVQQLCGG